MKEKSFDKNSMIENYLNEPLKIGDSIIVMGLGRQNKNEWGNSVEVIGFNEDNQPLYNRYNYKQPQVVIEKWKKNVGKIGYNPMQPEKRIRTLQYDINGMMSMLFRDDKYKTKNGLPIIETNLNPFVYKNGEKFYYQRDFVWTIEQCQNLIDSIYNNVDCGKILMRNKSYSQIEKLALNGETELYFRDVVDGKQRLTALKMFMDNEYPDKNGYYWKDFSDNAQWGFIRKQSFSFCELSEDTTDEEVLEQFLLMNFAGVPQSTEHLDYVKEILLKK